MGLCCCVNDESVTLLRGPCNACGKECETQHVHAYGAVWVGICDECNEDIDSFRLAKRARRFWAHKKRRALAFT